MPVRLGRRWRAVDNKADKVKREGGSDGECFKAVGRMAVLGLDDARKRTGLLREYGVAL